LLTNPVFCIKKRWTYIRVRASNILECMASKMRPRVTWVLYTWDKVETDGISASTVVALVQQNKIKYISRPRFRVYTRIRVYVYFLISIAWGLPGFWKACQERFLSRKLAPTQHPKWKMLRSIFYPDASHVCGYFFCNGYRVCSVFCWLNFPRSSDPVLYT
jgi:hypothetical protein